MYLNGASEMEFGLLDPFASNYLFTWWEGGESLSLVVCESLDFIFNGFNPIRMNDGFLVCGQITSGWNSIYKGIKYGRSLMIINKFWDFIQNWRMRCSTNKIMKISRYGFVSGWFCKRWVVCCINGSNDLCQNLIVVKRWCWLSIFVYRWRRLLGKSWVGGVVGKAISGSGSAGKSKRKEIFIGSVYKLFRRVGCFGGWCIWEVVWWIFSKCTKNVVK